MKLIPGAAFVLAAALAAAAAPAHAQPRTFPEQTKLGSLQVTSFPNATLDGRPIVMAPGTRILDTANRVAVPSTVGGAVTVRYKLDLLGQVQQVWILSPQEIEIARREAAAQRSAR